MGQTYKRKLVQRIFDNLTSFKQLFTEVKRAEQPKFVSVMTLVEKGQNFVVLACYACTSVSMLAIRKEFKGSCFLDKCLFYIFDFQVRYQKICPQFTKYCVTEIEAIKNVSKKKQLLHR